MPLATNIPLALVKSGTPPLARIGHDVLDRADALPPVTWVLIEDDAVSGEKSRL